MFHVKRFGTFDTLRKCTFATWSDVQRGDLGQALFWDNIKGKVGPENLTSPHTEGGLSLVESRKNLVLLRAAATRNGEAR